MWSILTPLAEQALTVDTHLYDGAGELSWYRATTTRGASVDHVRPGPQKPVFAQQGAASDHPTHCVERHVANLPLPVTQPRPLVYVVGDGEVHDSARDIVILQPDGDISRLLSRAVDARPSEGDSTASYRFSAAVALFGMLLRGSHEAGDATVADALELARGAIGDDVRGYRRAFVDMVELYEGQLATSVN